jgi:hypothetical protein
MMWSAKDRIRDNVAEPFDGPSAGRILTERNVGPNLIVKSYREMPQYRAVLSDFTC